MWGSIWHKGEFFVVDCGDLNGKSKFVDIVGFGSSKTVVFFVDDKFGQFGSALQKKLQCKFVKKQYILLWTFLCHPHQAPQKL